jgi:hypothetical protein
MIFYLDLTAHEEAEFKQLLIICNQKLIREKDIFRHNYLRNKKNKYLKQIGEKEI